MLFCLVLVNVQPAFSDTYSNNGFSITYPGGWKYQEQPSTDTNTVLVILFSNNIQTPEVNLWVELENTHRDATDDQTYLAELSAENKNFCDTFKSNGNSCYYSKLDESKTLEINGMKAYQIRFSWYGVDNKTVTHPNTSVVTEIPLGSKTWVIEASTAQVYYSAYVSNIQSITQSFSLVSQTQNSIPNNPSSPQVTPPRTLPTQQDTLTVSTDKYYYTDGDKIYVSGQVGQALSGFPVVIRIQTPNGNLLSVQQVVISSDGTYSATIHAGGNSWLEEGTYTILVQYGTKNLSAQTTFDFKKSMPQTTEQPQTTSPQTITESNPAPQMKIDLSGNSLLVVTIGMIVTVVIARIIIYFVRKSKRSGGIKSQGNKNLPPIMVDHRTLELRGNTVYLEITVQYQNGKSSKSWNRGTDKRIGSTDGGYLLAINLENRDESLMTEIADAIEKYGFNSPLDNYQNHKSFKSSKDISDGEASQIFEEICYYLEKKFPKKPTASGYKDPMHVQGSTEPSKVEPKYGTESIFTEKAPVGETVDDIKRERDERKKQREKEQEKIRKKLKEEQEKRNNEKQNNQDITGSNWAYRILGLNRTCSCEEVKSKSRELIKKYDPSRGNIHMTTEENEAANSKMREILKAREMINKEKGCTN
jgi:hypothetical protein